MTDEIHPREALKQPREARMLLAVLALAGVLFLLQEALGLSPAVIALGAAGLALVLVRPDVEATLDRVEWSVLVFFSGLFVMVGGLEASGVLDRIAEALAGLGSLDPVVLGIVVIWTVAALSAVVDNVPITIVVIPVISGLGAAGVDIEPIWWALAFGAGLGGNATVIGATANIVVVTQADRAGQPISSRQWVRYGIPVTVLTCAVASVGYALAVTFFW